MSIDIDFDIDKFRLDQSAYNAFPVKPVKSTKPQIVRNYRPEKWHIAYVPGPWIAEAAKLPGRALHVALAVQYVRGMEPGEEVILTRFHFDRFNIARGPTLRGMIALQEAGLIRYAKDGYKYKVTILPVPETSEISENAPRASC